MSTLNLTSSYPGGTQSRTEAPAANADATAYLQALLANENAWRRTQYQRAQAQPVMVQPQYVSAPAAPRPVSSPAQHGTSAIGQADPYGSAWDPRNPYYIPMKEPVGLTAGMIPGMGENPRNIPLAMRPNSGQLSDALAQQDMSRARTDAIDWNRYQQDVAYRNQIDAMNSGAR